MAAGAGLAWLAAAPAVRADALAPSVPSVAAVAPPAALVAAVRAAPATTGLPALPGVAVAASRAALRLTARALPRPVATGGVAIPAGPVVRTPPPQAVASRAAHGSSRPARRLASRRPTAPVPGVSQPIREAGSNSVVIIRIDSPGNDGSIVQINGATSEVTINAPTIGGPDLGPTSPGSAGDPAGSTPVKWVWNWTWCGAPVAAALATGGARQWTWNWTSSCPRPPSAVPDVGIPAPGIPDVGSASARARSHRAARRISARSVRAPAGRGFAPRLPAAFLPTVRGGPPRHHAHAATVAHRHALHRGRAPSPDPVPENGLLSDLPASSVTVSPGGSGSGGVTIGLVALVGLAIVMTPVGRRRRGHMTVPEALSSSRLERPG